MQPHTIRVVAAMIEDRGRYLITQRSPTAVVITHNIASAGMADRVMHLADGRFTHVDVNARKRTPAELSW